MQKYNISRYNNYGQTHKLHKQKIRTYIFSEIFGISSIKMQRTVSCHWTDAVKKYIYLFDQRQQDWIYNLIPGHPVFLEIFQRMNTNIYTRKCHEKSGLCKLSIRIPWITKFYKCKPQRFIISIHSELDTKMGSQLHYRKFAHKQVLYDVLYCEKHSNLLMKIERHQQQRRFPSKMYSMTFSVRSLSKPHSSICKVCICRVQKIVNVSDNGSLLFQLDSQFGNSRVPSI